MLGVNVGTSRQFTSVLRTTARLRTATARFQSGCRPERLRQPQSLETVVTVRARPQVRVLDPAWQGQVQAQAQVQLHIWR